MNLWEMRLFWFSIGVVCCVAGLWAWHAGQEAGAVVSGAVALGGFAKHFSKRR